MAYYELDGKSAIRGRTGYALPPAGPDGNRESNLWTWSLVLNSRCTRRQAAWRFIEWAAGKEFLLRSAFEGNMNPTRRSSWEDARFRQAAAGWDGYYQADRQLLETHARVLPPPTSTRSAGDRQAAG